MPQIQVWQRAPTHQGPVVGLCPSARPGSPWIFPIPFIVSARSHLTPATCVPDPRLAMVLPGQGPFAVVSIACPWMSGMLSPSICHHCLESCNTNDLCTGSRFGSEILLNEAQVSSVSICRSMGCAGAVSESIRSHCSESSHTSDLCTGCMLKAKSHTQRCRARSVSICQLIYFRGYFWFR